MQRGFRMMELAVAGSPAPFSGVEWMIALRFLRARRAEGGVGVMAWISLIGITLAVFALIATLAVRSGFRAEFVDAVLGGGAHVTVRAAYDPGSDGTLRGYVAAAERVRAAPGVVRVAPLVRGQAMASFGDRSAGADVRGIAPEDLAAIPRVADPQTSFGDIGDLSEGIALGSGLARSLGVRIGDRVRLILPNGAKTPFGTAPRVGAYDVVYIFSAGRHDIDMVRAYLPFDAAQILFDREGRADELEVMLDDPESLDPVLPGILGAAGEGAALLTWRDVNGGFLRALDIEDNVMFVILSVLVLVAAMNITSGLVMLVKNKGGDVGVLRTMGLTEGAVMRVFFICGAATGAAGTALGVALGCAFAVWSDAVFAAVNALSGGQAWDPAIRGIYHLPAKLEASDVLAAAALSMALSLAAAVIPARRAARLDPVEALRNE